jgi:hypothetical protein
MHRFVRAVRVVVALVFLPLASAHAQGRVAGAVFDARFRPIEGAIVGCRCRDSSRTNSAGASASITERRVGLSSESKRLADPLTTSAGR